MKKQIWTFGHFEDILKSENIFKIDNFQQTNIHFILGFLT